LYITVTGIDLSKIFGGKPTYWGGIRVVITDECIGTSEILGVHDGLPSKSMLAVAKTGHLLTESAGIKIKPIWVLVHGITPNSSILDFGHNIILVNLLIFLVLMSLALTMNCYETMQS